MRAANHVLKCAATVSQLLENQEDDPIPGSSAAWQSVAQTHEDMKHSIFCVCPPGIAQQTLRVWRSIMSGCIPVTFFQGHDNPFPSSVNYEDFSININPDEHHLLHKVLAGLLSNPQKIQDMQHELSLIQQGFVWDKKNKKGVYDMIYAELANHPARFLRPQSWASSWFICKWLSAYASLQPDSQVHFVQWDSKFGCNPTQSTFLFPSREPSMRYPCYWHQATGVFIWRLWLSMCSQPFSEELRIHINDI